MKGAGSYLLKSEVSEPWTLQAATYKAYFRPNEWSLTLSQQDVEALAEKITPFTLNPSFLKIAAGIKIRF